MSDVTGELSGYPHVIPRPGTMRKLLKLFGQKPEWRIDDLADVLGRQGRHVYGAVFGLRRKYGVEILTLSYGDDKYGYRANLTPGQAEALQREIAADEVHA